MHIKKLLSNRTIIWPKQACVLIWHAFMQTLNFSNAPKKFFLRPKNSTKNQIKTLKTLILLSGESSTPKRRTTSAKCSFKEPQKRFKNAKRWGQFVKNWPQKLIRALYFQKWRVCIKKPCVFKRQGKQTTHLWLYLVSQKIRI